ncbi:MAG: VWA domain-containing protein, partial [Clostridiaceae bacterium]|nr:VWA domain-containing protein [Clostridiaceae bacterium]
MKEGLSKFLLKKKIFSLIMAVSILFGMLPATASALAPGLQIGETSKNGDTKTEPRTSLSDGEIWVDKSVEYVDDGEFEITLSAAGQKYSIGNQVPGERADVVLMLDTSMSMGSGRNSKLENMKTAAQSAVDKLLGVEGNRVALVTFNSVATLSNDFTYDINALKGKIGNLKTASGTNIQNAFLVAQNALLNRNDRSRIPVIILLSDGAPSYYYESLTNHDNRKPNYPTESNEAVWWTIQQAMETKRVIADNLKDNDGPNELKIYTIGFGVGTNNRAIAT